MTAPTNLELLNPSRLSPVERLFCCALADDREWHTAELPGLWREVGDDAVWAFALRNRAESVVGAALQSVLGCELPERWIGAIGAVRKRISAYMCELDRVAGMLRANGIAIVALKNSGIARSLMSDVALCPMGDVDVLVRPDCVILAHDRLRQLGYRLDLAGRDSALKGRTSSWMVTTGRRLGWLAGGDDNSTEDAIREGGTEYKVRLPDGSELHFELQCRPIAGRWIRPEREPSADALIAHSVPVSGTLVRVLSAEDNLLQVCLHTAKHSFVRAPGFRLHTDVDRIVRCTVINWDVYLSQVRVVGVATAAYVSLLIPTILLRTPVPESVLESLRPPRWKEQILIRWILRVGLFDPETKKWSKLGYILFNIFLYDSLWDAFRGAFPSGNWMIRRYGVRKKWSLPVWYAARLVGLVFDRANT